MNRIRSSALTLLCGMIILALGYVGIVKGGGMLLHNENSPQKTDYENTGANVFYGKIDDDIEIFPWNSYPVQQEGMSQELDPAQGGEVSMGYPEFDYKQWNLAEKENQLFYSLIGFYTGDETKEISQWYAGQQKDIVGNMERVDTGYESFYFYQDIIQAGGKAYQIKLACNDWSILSLTCVELRSTSVKDTQEWEDGKKRLVSILDKYKDIIEPYMQETAGLFNQGIQFNEGKEGSRYQNSYIEIMGMLNLLLEESDSLSSLEANEKIRKASNVDEQVEFDIVVKEGASQTEMADAYQVIELNDMILLLVQGEETFGIYYDPITQKVCGYNYFFL